MAQFIQCRGVNEKGERCKNQAITEYCRFCDPERKEYKKGTVIPIITGGIGGSVSYGSLKSALEQFNRHVPRKKKKKHQNRIDDWAGDFELAGSDSYYFDQRDQWPQSTYLAPVSSSYSSSYSPKPYVELKLGERREIDRIAHMVYLVERGQDGKYYPIYQSRHLADDTVLNELTGKSHYTFWAAEGEFHGTEGLYRIRERMKKAADPNWIPPNLRRLAVFGQWQFIEEKDKPRLIEWMKAGCKDWHGPWPKKKEEKEKEKKKENKKTRWYDRYDGFF